VFTVMQRQTSFFALLLCTVGLTLGMTAQRVAGQTEAELGLETYAGLTVTGAVATVYSMEYVTDLTSPSESDWECLEFFQLPASPYLWTDVSAPTTGKRFYRAVAMVSPADFVFIPPGTFRMGTPVGETGRQSWEGPQTAVTISRGLWMGRHEVTQNAYFEVMGVNPSQFKVDVNAPVESVTWSDAIAFCATLTARERGAERIPSGSAYRLPTEAEWEYACRSLTSTRFSYGDDPGTTQLTNHAWYGDNSSDQTHAVGQKLPNAWGLYDMHGNVWEWCQDWWLDSLPGGTLVDPQGPVSGLYRVVRGGSWGGGAWFQRSGVRSFVDPGSRSHSFGFRVVLAVGNSSPTQ
jgi:formylglycine-generating enzyme required for sulfatase activity